MSNEWGDTDEKLNSLVMDGLTFDTNLTAEECRMVEDGPRREQEARDNMEAELRRNNEEASKLSSLVQTEEEDHFYFVRMLMGKHAINYTEDGAGEVTIYADDKSEVTFHFECGMLQRVEMRSAVYMDEVG